jgi:hypothetical protein
MRTVITLSLECLLLSAIFHQLFSLFSGKHNLSPALLCVGGLRCQVRVNFTHIYLHFEVPFHRLGCGYFSYRFQLKVFLV